MVYSPNPVTLSSQGHCLRMVLDETNQSSDKQSKFRDITKSKAQSDDGPMRTETVTVSENSFLDMIKRNLWINMIFYPDKPIQ